MLDPDYLEQAGEKVASVYTQIESEMLDFLAQKMIDGDVAGQRAQTAIHLLSQSATSQLMEIVGRHERDIDAAVKVEVSDALRRSDADDLARIKQGLGVVLPSVPSRQMAATVAGARDILSRQNLLMAEGAKNAFIKQSLWAVTQVNTGAMTTERALHMAVRQLEREGISTITYRNAKTGAQTVQNKVDVAIRRHIRTQIAQDGMRLTELRMDEAGVDLVEVSSHGGSRPSHARWEGRIYSRNGDKTIGGVHYRDFKSACNWGDVADGIGGANCRHSYAAWFPGMERTYRPNPEHPSGKTNKEVYDLTQRQRAGERAIRQTKRELSGAQMIVQKTKDADAMADTAKLQIRLRDQQSAMRSLISDNPKVLQRSPRREWAGDMPKVKVPAQGRKRAASSSPSKGGSVDTLAGVQRGKEMAFEKADGKKANPNYGQKGYSTNCQSCVVTYEARRRGFDVQTLSRNETMERLSHQTNLAWIDPSTGKHPEYMTSEKVKNASQCRDWLDGVIEKGNRYTIEFSWKGHGNTGHIVHIDRLDNGRMRIYDPQSAKQFIDEDIVTKTYTAEEIERRKRILGARSKRAKQTAAVKNEFLDYLRELRYEVKSYGIKFSTAPKVLRVDNMEFDPDIAGNIMEEVK